MFKWIQSFLTVKEKEKKEVINNSTCIDKPTNNYQSASDYLIQFKCKLHPEYTANKIPINNCNICWEYFSQRCKYRH